MTEKNISRVGQHIYFYDEVDPESIHALAILLKEVERESKTKHIQDELDHPPIIHLHVHSYGGDAYSGLAGASAVLGCSVPVYTYVEGGVASAATLITMAGKKRFIHSLGFMLIHQISTWTQGTYENLLDSKDNSTQLMDTFCQFYESKSKLKHKQIKKILKRDLWFSAADCKAFGLVDEIL